ncbi:MAG: hypothetical protein HYV42_04400 [Candidatus Magasanikbacteria bacterium]|nr:hypothetical protein [Candidatus Magasanikbacteria bacterium]
MTWRQYCLVLTLGTLFSLAAWVLILVWVNPDESGRLGIILFYASLLAFIGGSTILIGLSREFPRDRAAPLRYQPARQAAGRGLAIASGVLLLLILLRQGLATWFSGLLILGGGLLIFRFTRRSRSPASYDH